MRVEWSPSALASTRHFMADQPGMRAISTAVAALAEDSVPATRAAITACMSATTASFT